MQEAKKGQRTPYQHTILRSLPSQQEAVSGIVVDDLADKEKLRKVGYIYLWCEFHFNSYPALM